MANRRVSSAFLRSRKVMSFYGLAVHHSTLANNLKSGVLQTAPYVLENCVILRSCLPSIRKVSLSSRFYHGSVSSQGVKETHYKLLSENAWEDQKKLF